MQNAKFRMKTAAAFLAALLLAGCFDGKNPIATIMGRGKSVSCSAPAVQEMVKDLLAENVEKKALDANRADTGSRYDLGKVRAMASGIAYTLDEVVTVERDTKNAKKICRGRLSMVIGENVVTPANGWLQKHGKIDVADFADHEGFDGNFNRFSANLFYSVQPADSGDKLFATFDNVGKFQGVIEYAVFHAMAADMLAAINASIAQHVAEQVEQEKADAEEFVQDLALQAEARAEERARQAELARLQAQPASSDVSEGGVQNDFSSDFLGRVQSVRVGPGHLNVRSCAGTHCAPLGVLPAQVPVELASRQMQYVAGNLGVMKPWVQVQYRGQFCPAASYDMGTAHCTNWVNLDSNVVGWVSANNLVFD